MTHKEFIAFLEFIGAEIDNGYAGRLGFVVYDLPNGRIVKVFGTFFKTRTGDFRFTDDPHKSKLMREHIIQLMKEDPNGKRQRKQIHRQSPSPTIEGTRPYLLIKDEYGNGIS